ncbi:MAG: endonuclease MutS2 [Bacteroidales bacterium]|nr:endonuclease MutS2 [Bacteroidales bacterium]
MIYPGHFEQKIGFDQVRQLLNAACTSSLGREKVDALTFLTDYDSLVVLLDRNQEYLNLLNSEQSLPDCHFHDARPSLRKARVEGSWLDEAEVFNLRKSLDSILHLVRFFSREEMVGPYPRLVDLTSEVPVFPDVIKRADAILTPTGEIKDNASPELAAIRHEMTTTLNSLSRRLQQILRQAQQEGLVDKDTTPSMRDGRLVIPVAPAFKRRIKGIVHDESATGKTVFIEPAELVEANNRIRELENEERREIIRILTRFTDFIRPDVADMAKSYDLLAELDFLKAKASFARTIGAIRPRFEPKPILDWVKAVHPLLFLSLRKQHKDVVPLNLTLTDKQRILIISGPNAGGKSVCLKTIGLLQYMLQCGLLIPVHDSSSTGCFERLFIDIGDEQSIEDDLSTYSSHLLNMKYFLRNSQENTLLLIDEFGTGTEPSIGGAIAEACLDRFNRQKAYGVITTHYSNLKHYANDHEGVVNGAMLYDRHEMRPLFTLEIGRPGSSFAVEIARKIGLPEELIKQASGIVGSDYVDMDKYLQDIVRDKRYWENKREQVRIKEKKTDNLLTQLEGELADLQKQRKEILGAAKQEASRLLNESNAKIEQTIRQIKEAQAERTETKQIRQELASFKQSLEETSEQTDEKILRKIQKIKRKEENKQQKAQRGEQNAADKGQHKRETVTTPLAVQDTVTIKGQQTPGTIVEIKGKKAKVVFGMVQTTVPIDRLERTTIVQKIDENPYKTLGRRSTEEVHEKKLQFKLEIDVRGMRGNEALQAVMYYIDDAIMTGVTRVRILHGTGTGALRQLIRQYLGTVKSVKDYHDEHVQFGGAGITVVELD